ncbi:MAG: hypothetical protein ACRDHP_01960 [Ktedonobacterales bacterium]
MEVSSQSREVIVVLIADEESARQLAQILDRLPQVNTRVVADADELATILHPEGDTAVECAAGVVPMSHQN